MVFPESVFAINYNCCESWEILGVVQAKYEEENKNVSTEWVANRALQS